MTVALKNSLISGLVIALLLPAAAAAETWSCNYDGSWEEKATGNKGDFVWKVTWRSKADGWSIFGEYTDAYGLSVLDGTCDDHKCSLKQTYRTGTLKGEAYYWVGTYTDAKKGKKAGQTRNRFEGTWGPSEKDAKSGGPWKAIATCTKQ